MSNIVVKAVIVSPPKIHKTPKPKRIWDNYQEVAEVIKSDYEKFVIAAAARDGVKYLNIREFYFKRSEGIWKPGRDGITIPLLVPVEKGTRLITPFPEFAEALAKASLVAEGLELYDADKAVYYTPKEKNKDDKTIA